MNGMAHGSQWSCACFAFASAFIPIPVTQTNNGVHVVHQFETTPKKNFCMRETHFNFIFYFGIRWNRWVRDATPFCSTVCTKNEWKKQKCDIIENWTVVINM